MATQHKSTSNPRQPAMVPHCLMCGSLVEKEEGVVNWSMGFPFLFCSRECQSDYRFVNARRLGHHFPDRGRWLGQERVQQAVSAA